MPELPHTGCAPTSHTRTTHNNTMKTKTVQRNKGETAREKKASVSSAGPIVAAQEHVAKTFQQLTDDLRELQTAFEKEREAVDTDKLKKPGHGAHNFDQPVLALGDLAAKIEDTMTDTLYPWIQEFNQRGAVAVSVPKLVLPQLFKECFNEVKQRHQLIKSVLFPKGAKTDAALQRDHMCSNNEELFLLTPSEELNKAVQLILDSIRAYLVERQFAEQEISFIVDGTRLDVVVRKYREIMVQVCLQEPAATFSNDCGMYLEVIPKRSSVLPSWLAAPATTAEVQPFDPKRHSKPVDCMEIGEGDQCIVVFPAVEVGGATPTLTPSYTLGLKQKALPPAQGPSKTQQQPSQVDSNISIVRDELDVWETTPASLKTVGQLRKLFVAISNMDAALRVSTSYAGNVYSDLGISQERVDRWTDDISWFNSQQIPNDANIGYFGKRPTTQPAGKFRGGQ